MAKHLVKCFYCGQTFDANEEEYVKPRANRYAHKACHESADSAKTKEERDKELLFDYIKYLFKVNTVPIKIVKQLEKYTKENNYTYSGIYKTLKYFYEIKGNSIEKANGGIGIVPYQYQEAYIYWRSLWEAQQQNEGIKIEEYVMPTREIHIYPPTREPIKQIRKLFTFLEEDDT